jgi:hypothetical protein
MRALLTLLCAAGVALPAPAQQPVPPVPGVVQPTPYYPLKKGTKWSYKAGTDVVVVEVGDTKKIGTDDATELKTSVGGVKVGDELVAVRADGVYRLAVNGQPVVPALCFLKLPIKKGDSWAFDMKIGPPMGAAAPQETLKGKFTLSEETATVGGKKYEKAVKVTGQDLLANGQKMNLTCWYAENVGMVKLSAELSGVPIGLELVNFELPK